jgi:hypothetical protein
MRPRQPTHAQLQVLRDLAANREPGDRVRDACARGGLTRTLYALRRYGWTNWAFNITDDGRAFVQSERPDSGVYDAPSTLP